MTVVKIIEKRVVKTMIALSRATGFSRKYRRKIEVDGSSEDKIVHNAFMAVIIDS